MRGGKSANLRCVAAKRLFPPAQKAAFVFTGTVLFEEDDGLYS
jgi:hypothetical protein